MVTFDKKYIGIGPALIEISGTAQWLKLDGIGCLISVWVGEDPFF